MRTKHWLPLVSGLIAASPLAGCGSDASQSTGPSGGNAGTASAGHGGTTSGGGGASGGTSGGIAGSATAGASGAMAGAGGAIAGAGGAMAGAGGAMAGAGGAMAGAGGAMAGAGGAMAGAGGAMAGAGGAMAGAGGAMAGAGGAMAGAGGGGASGAGGSGGATPSPLCDVNLWKYTFQFCPHNFAAADNQPTLAVDGDTTTFVTSGAAQSGAYYAVFDLHGAVTVSSLTLDYGAGAKAGDSSASLNLQGSDDGVTFTDITGVISGTLLANKLTITVPTTTTHRFLKLLQIGSSGSWWAIPELGITCGAGTPAAPPADAGTASDRSQWKIFTPNSQCAVSGAASNMIDADTASFWQSVGRPGVGYWIRVDLGTTAALKGVHLKNQGPDDFPASVKVQVSSDDINYVDAITGVTGAVDMDMIFAATKNARFFRILSEADNAAGHWWTVTDLNIDL